VRTNSRVRQLRSVLIEIALDDSQVAARALRRVGAHMPASLVFGRRFAEARELLLRSERWDRAECQNWIAERLARATEALPEDPEAPEWPQWLNLPARRTVTRDELSSAPDRFLRETFTGRTRTISTGGTGGKPAFLKIDPAASSAEWAYMQRMWERYGYRRRDRRLVLRGLPLKDGRPVSYDPLLAELRVSPFRLGGPWRKAIEADVRSFKPRFVHGYPSAVERLAEIWRGPLPRIEALFLASETLTTERWDRFEEEWQAPVLSWYGHSEKQALGGNCPGNRAFHMFPTYGLSEIITDGRRQAEAGEFGTIVATGFVSEALKIVRYETGDVARFVGWGCESCGMDWPLIDSVTGRWGHDPLIGRHGVPISMTALNFHSSVFEGIRRLRYVQEHRGRAELLLEVDELGDKEKRSIARAIRSKVGDELEVTLSRVDEIPLTPSGKHILVDQRINDR